MIDPNSLAHKFHLQDLERQVQRQRSTLAPMRSGNLERAANRDLTILLLSRSRTLLNSFVPALRRMAALVL